MVGSASAAMARGFSGNWPLTVTQSQHSNGSYCLTLNDSGSIGFPHSGSASLTGPGGKLPYGTFQLIDHILVVTIQQPGGSQNAGLVFIAPVGAGGIGKGAYDQVYGGEAFDSGALVFGTKGGC
jgi:hypothetical protein